MYQGSEAYSLYGAERVRRQESHAPFEVVRGGGLDAQVRQGVSHTFVSRLVVAMAAVTVFVCLGFCRVALTTATVSQLQQTASLKEDIVSATATNNDLQIERSVLSSSSRIDRIATQNYGMVYPTSSDSITVGESGNLDEALSTPIAADAAEEAADEDPEASADATQNAAAADPRLMTS